MRAHEAPTVSILFLSVFACGEPDFGPAGLVPSREFAPPLGLEDNTLCRDGVFTPGEAVFAFHVLLGTASRPVDIGFEIFEPTRTATGAARHSQYCSDEENGCWVAVVQFTLGSTLGVTRLEVDVPEQGRRSCLYTVKPAPAGSP